MTPYDEIQVAIESKTNFVLQGGAGSGKTETLKVTLEYISTHAPTKRVACITHTNLAAEEIASRVTGEHYIGTIHSFLASLIKDYKKNIKEIIDILFILKKTYEYKKTEGEAAHKSYKKAYEKYQTRLYSLKKEKIDKCIDKRQFDKDPDNYTHELNAKIDDLNLYIRKRIESTPTQAINYNESPFDSLDDLSYGHDGLIQLSAELIKRHRKLRRILSDRYDYIFIDEYQDTSPIIIDSLLTKFGERSPVFGLFGDSMQGIYEDGIGDVNEYIKKAILRKIKKPDNYRCSEQVIRFINRFRTDDLQQELALKKVEGNLESVENRQGLTKLFYIVIDNKPHSRSSAEEKSSYINTIHSLIETAKGEMVGPFRILMLTNKAIAEKAGFGKLYEIFSNRFGRNLKDQLEKTLNTLQFNEIFNLIKNKEDNKTWATIENIKKSGYRLDSAASKKTLSASIKKLTDPMLSANEAISNLLSLRILSEAPSRARFITNSNIFLESLNKNSKYQDFKLLYTKGHNTFAKIQKENFDIDEYEFNELEKDLTKEIFIQSLLADSLKLSEIVNYFRYLNEESEYITIHKTKGTGIKNTIVVFEEFFGKTTSSMKFSQKSIFQKYLPQVKKFYMWLPLEPFQIFIAYVQYHLLKKKILESSLMCRRR
ncbi:ATP-dependent helicase [Pseudomonas aeruginosa]|uniref:UvrD-helicase domain-containing protein n=1 Tax=Pseudomonas aeruginosa TaxID=287 RepID=UPI001067FD2D|nr:UvrD-helicase domain-containing protein [Pseudomonas aeruginosa]TEQ20010.1 ATP-dependent helicase [Pseudomonas aeruginosa]